MTADPVTSPRTMDERGYVADLLPATAEPPEPARRINFFKALLLFWLLPSRYGPHLAVGSWTRALAAHAISIVFAAGFLGVPFLGDVLGLDSQVMGPRDLRTALAEQVLRLAETSVGAAVPWASAVMVIGAVPLIEIALLLIATGAMPWCAGGDRASSVWKRSTKNVYWSTTIMIPAALLASLARLVDTNRVSSDELAILLGLILLIVPPVLILRMLVVGAGRYVGAPDGPAFAPREPHCDGCGYTLIRLPLGGNCPECGLPVGDSLPGGKRRPTVWQQYELRPRGVLELIRLQWLVLRDPRFFERLPVQSGLAAARHFWWGTFLMILFAFLAASKIGLLATPADSRWQSPLAALAVIAVLVPFPLQAAMMCFGGMWSQFRYGIRDYRVSAVVCYYAAPLMWPLVIALTLGPVIANDPVSSRLDRWNLFPFHSGAYFTAWHAALIFFAALVIGLLVFWGRRLIAALGSVLYANA